MTAEKARAILAEAKKNETYEAPIPEDDAKAISEAEDLVEMARNAWEQYVRGPEVEALLRIADEEFSGNGDAPKEEKPKFDPITQKVDPPPEEPKPEPTPEPEPESSEEGEADLSKVEPWDNYDKEKVADIIAGVNAAVKEYATDELVDLMGHVWTYESANKERATILNHLEAIGKKIANGEKVETPEEPKAEQTEQPAPEPQETPEEAPPKEETPAVPAETEPEPTPPVETEMPKGDPEPEQKPKPAPKEEPKQEEAPPEDLDGEAKLIEMVERQLEGELLHKPKPPEEQIPDLPFDWTKMSDAELQRFHGVYANAAHYKNWQTQRDDRLAIHWRDAANELHNELLTAAEKYDENGKQKTMTLLEAEIESDENVKRYRRKQRKHETFASAHRRERDSFYKLVEALSRLESMRHQEWQRSGQGSGRGR